MTSLRGKDYATAREQEQHSCSLFAHLCPLDLGKVTSMKRKKKKIRAGTRRRKGKGYRPTHYTRTMYLRGFI